MPLTADKQVFEVNVTKKDGIWTGDIPTLKMSATNYDEGEMKTDLLNQLKAHLNMNKDTHGAFVKRKWYITVRPKRNIKIVEDNDDDSDDNIFSLFE